VTSRPSTIIKYPGSKAQHAARIVRECAPPFDPTTLVDAMCGSCAWGLAAHAVFPRAQLWLNDTNAELVRVLLAIRDHPEWIARKLELTPYSRWLWDRLRTRRRNIARPGDPVDLHRVSTSLADLADVVDWLMVNRQSVGGATAHTGTGWSRDQLGKKIHQWRRLPELLYAMARELCRGATIECLDFEALLFGGQGQRFGLDSPTTWVYVDPPYVGREHYYGCPGGIEFHERLAAALSRCQSWVTVSYADTEEFRASVGPLYQDWHRIDYTAVQHMSIRGNGTGKGTRRELLLTNYRPQQMALSMAAS